MVSGVTGRGPARAVTSPAHRRREVVLAGPGAAAAADIAGAIPDPELPMLSLANLGVLREVAVDNSGAVTVTLTPTYSGCPATRVMATDVEAALRDAGYADVSVQTVLGGDWTSADVSDTGRRALAEAGIAPPVDGADQGASGAVIHSVACPQCGSTATEEISRFGATACKAIYRCLSCLEPFEYFKAHL